MPNPTTPPTDAARLSEPKYDPALFGTFRAVQVPGAEIVAAYCALTDAINATPEYSDAERIAEARRDGFADAVEMYCPSTPCYSNTRGHLLMQADLYMMEKVGEDVGMCGGVLSGEHRPYPKEAK